MALAEGLQEIARTVRELLRWDRYSAVNKLAILGAAASLAAVCLDQWGPLIALLLSILLSVRLTGALLSGRWVLSPEPIAPYVERLRGLRDALSAGWEHSAAQELRARSESIASSHIPDLDLGPDPLSGSSFSRNIRLELNSIVLLIVRDFVQVWYHSFSYDSQFLKDTRQFLFKSIHSLAERVARLQPHRTSVKIICAYQAHLSSLERARCLLEVQPLHSPEGPHLADKTRQLGAQALHSPEGPRLAGKTRQLDAQAQHSTRKPHLAHRTSLQRLESVDEAFQSRFEFHPALKSAEAEKKYLRSVTKTILLAVCARDVVSPASAQVFFTEVLAVNVLLPVVDTLSCPDRLYQLLIRLLYSDDSAIFTDDILKQLIDAELQKVSGEGEDCQAYSTDHHDDSKQDSCDQQVPQSDARNTDIPVTCQATDIVSQTGHISQPHPAGDLSQSAALGKGVKQVTCVGTKKTGSCLSRDLTSGIKSEVRSTVLEKTVPMSSTSGLSVNCNSERRPSLPLSLVVTEQDAGANTGKNGSQQQTAPPDTGTTKPGPAKYGRRESAGKDPQSTLEKHVEDRSAGENQSVIRQVVEGGSTGDSQSVPPMGASREMVTTAAGSGSDIQSEAQTGHSMLAVDCRSAGDGTNTEHTKTDGDERKKEASQSSQHVAAPSDSKCEVEENVGENLVYGEIVSTGFPAVRPKLQAFKDLFKTKKAKQQEESKGQSVPDKVTDVEKADSVDTSTASGAGQTASELATGSIPTALRIKSLRLSPLLSRSNKLFGSGGQDKLSSDDAVKDGAGDKTSPVCSQASDKQTPSPLPTPSPSQQTKGGPLSFFRFRKPTLEFRKSTSPASIVDGQLSDKAGPDRNSAPNRELSEEKDPSLLLQRLPGLSGEGSSASTGTVPTVCVTDEDAKTNMASTSTSTPATIGHLKQAASAPSLRTVSMSSYEELHVSDVKDDGASMRPSFSATLGDTDDLEVGEDATTLGEGAVLSQPDSSLIFQDISISTTSTDLEFRSKTPYTLYHIEYESLHFSESGLPVLRTGSVKRRYREFINLMSRLEDNSAYKKLLKDVKGPKRWQALPFKNMDKDSVANRQRNLEQFLKSLIQVEAVCNGPELREFLAYEGDSHIAFVRKASEISMPRLDKMLARTVSGVFDKLKSLPSLPQEVISGIRGRDSSVDRREGSQERDPDIIDVRTDFAQESDTTNALRDIAEKFVRDCQIEGLRAPELEPAPVEGSSALSQQILSEVPRAQGDGAEMPDTHEEGAVADGGPGQLMLFDPVLDLVVTILQGQDHWLCQQRVVTILRNIFGITVDRWLKDGISSLTTEERCLYYIRLLRETIWPGGTFFSGIRPPKSEEEKQATRRVAKRLLLQVFPGVVRLVVGADSLDAAAEQILESMQYTKLNKHFIYTTLDMLLDTLFPEMADPKFQARLLS